MLHLQRRTLDAVGAARLRSGVGHVETVGVMDGYGSYPYYSSTKIRKLHLCYAKNVHQPWPLALKFPLLHAWSFLRPAPRRLRIAFQVLQIWFLQ